MSNSLPDSQLRTTIKELGVAKVARAANVAATTLYSFVRGDNLHLRSDIRHQVVKAIAQLTGNEIDDDQLERVVFAWGALTPEQQKLVADMAQNMMKERK